MESDAALVQRARAGQRSAFRDLVERYQRSVLATTETVLHDAHLAEDAAQQALLAAYEQLHTLRNPRAFGSWLLVITRREAIALARMAGRQPNASMPDGLGASTGSPRLVDDAELLDAIQQLSEHERVVVLLRHFDGHSMAEISEITGHPVGTVTKQHSRAVRRLRTLLIQELQR